MMRNSILFLLLFGRALFALPANNPALASLTCEGVFFTSECRAPLTACETLSVRIGYYGDFLFNDYMEIDNASRTDSIRTTRIYTNGGEIDFNLWDRYEAFVVLGVSDVWLQSPISSFVISNPTTNSLFSIETESDFAWGIGGRMTVWKWTRLFVGIEGQYFGTKPRINFVEDHANAVSLYVDDQTLRYRAWQIGLGLTYEVALTPCFSFLPYATLIGSGASIEMGEKQIVTTAPQTVQLFDLKKSRRIGYAVGATLLGGERVLITTEGRFAYEKALFLSAQMRL